MFTNRTRFDNLFTAAVVAAIVALATVCTWAEWKTQTVIDSGTEEAGQ